jgi:hypothetical protein
MTMETPGPSKFSLLEGVNKSSLAACLVMIILGSVLIFAQLGTYALWDDEAMDALSARGVTQTGDVTAMLGDNIVAYRNGLLLVNLRHQGMPPLPAYLVAVSFLTFGESAWSARLPFALSGFAFLLLAGWWSLRLRLPPTTQWLLTMGILGNVSLMLYFRNCHYYGLGIFFNTAIVYLYLFHLRTRAGQLGIAILAGLFMTANPSWFVTLSFCLFIDYLVWRRREYILKLSDLVTIFLPQFFFGLLMLWKFNPLGTNLGGYLGKNTPLDRVKLFWWNWRDLNACEFIPVILLIIALFGLPYWKNRWILRSLTALFLYVCVVTVVSTQIIPETSVADIRYVAGSLPLCVALAVMVILELSRGINWLALVLGAVTFGTNLLHGGPFLGQGLRSTILAFRGELIRPNPEPFTAASQWLRENVRKGESVWVIPEYMTYPMLFHAPKAVYAWQLEANNTSPQFKNLPPIHFQGRQPPDYILVFGPPVQPISNMVEQWSQQNQVRYERVARIDTFWKDLYRPELFWRRFEPTTEFHPDYEAIYVFKRTAPPVGTSF